MPPDKSSKAHLAIWELDLSSLGLMKVVSAELCDKTALNFSFVQLRKWKTVWPIFTSGKQGPINLEWNMFLWKSGRLYLLEI